MAPKCYICNCYVTKNVSLFRIPDRDDEYSERCGLWLKLLNEKSQNMHNIRICGEHFLKSNLFIKIYNSTIYISTIYNNTTKIYIYYKSKIQLNSNVITAQTKYNFHF